ncbi:MAG: hypothetical protein ABIF12_03800 [bacterium]
MNKFKILSLLILLSLSFKPIYLEPQAQESAQLESETVSTLTKIKDYFKNITGELKTTLNNMTIDSAEIKLVSNLPDNRGRFGMQIPIGAGLVDIDKGFNPVAVNLLSPTIKELRLPKIGKVLELVPDLNNSRLLNLILNINLNPYERKVLEYFKNYRDGHNGQMSSVEKFIVSIRDLMEPVFAPIAPFFFVENRVVYLKPVQVASVKFALLLKTYVKTDKKKLAQELPLFFSKFLSSADWDKTKVLPENEGKPWTEWTDFVKYEDPEVLDKLIPQFVKDVIANLPLDVSLAEYLEIKDGFSDYLLELSLVWKRGSVDSKAKYFIDNIVLKFNPNMNPTEIRKTAIAIATMCNDFNKANLPGDTKERLLVIIDDFIKVLSKISLVGPLSSWNAQVIGYMEELKSLLNNNSEIDFDISKLDMTQDRKLTLVELISYYKKKADQLLNYKHPGEDGYIFEFSELNLKQALYLLLSMSYRLHKDVKIAMNKVALLKSDVQVDIDDKKVALGRNAYKQRIGSAGAWNSRTNRWDIQGSGLIFAEQNALMALRRNPQNRELKKTYSVAKDKRIEAQGKYAFDVARVIEINIGKQLKTPYSAFLGDFNILIRRFEKAKPLLDVVAGIYESVGLPFPTTTLEEDLESSQSPFEVDFFSEESGFDGFVPDESWKQFSMESF